MDGTRIQNFEGGTSWKTGTWKTDKIRDCRLKMNLGTQVVGVTDGQNWFRIMCCYRPLITVDFKRPYLERSSFVSGKFELEIFWLV